MPAHTLPVREFHTLSPKTICIHSTSSRVGDPATVASLTPLRVGLLGLGTVGGGVFELLESLPQRFFVCGILVKDRQKHLQKGAPGKLLVTQPEEIFDHDCDLIVETIGDPPLACRLIAEALLNGIDVVTANKVVIAEHGEELRRLAEKSGSRFLWSASVGGGVPIIECLRNLIQTEEIQSLEAVLNGTTNDVLDSIHSGIGWNTSIQLAQQRGFAEADPTSDLDGSDAAYKLQILAWECFNENIDFEDVERIGIDSLNEKEIALAARIGCRYRSIGKLNRSPSGIAASVKPELVSATHPFFSVEGAGNFFRLKTISRKTISLKGLGAGRWPTARSVFGDIQTIEQSRKPTFTNTMIEQPFT